MLTRHFRACARADGSKPEPAGHVHRGRGRRPVHRPVRRREELGADPCATRSTTFTRPPSANDDTTLARAASRGVDPDGRDRPATWADANGALPVVSYLTQAAGAMRWRPMMLGVFSGVIDPRERERILCDADIVPVKTDRWGQILDQGRSTSVWNSRAPAEPSPCGVRIASGPAVRSPPPGAMRTTSTTGNTAGPTSLANGVHLCRRHHVFLHQHRDWHSTFDQQHFRVYRADGTEVHPHAWPELHAAV